MRKPKGPLKEALIKVSFLCMLLSGTVMVGPQGAQAQAVNPVAIPQQAYWLMNMIQFGRSHCNNPDSNYDAERVFYQIQGYTEDPTWKACGDTSKAWYRDQYVLSNNGQIPGYWVFTKGLMLDYQRTQGSQSKAAVELLATISPWARDGYPNEWTLDYSVSREMAYALMAYVDYELLGNPNRPRYDVFLNSVLGHVDQWFVTQTW